jgi:hypothetical protein
MAHCRGKARTSFGLVQAGVPELFADVLVASHLALARGKMGPEGSAVKALTGSAPTGAAEFHSAQRGLLLQSSAASIN